MPAMATGPSGLKDWRGGRRGGGGRGERRCWNKSRYQTIEGTRGWLDGDQEKGGPPWR